MNILGFKNVKEINKGYSSDKKYCVSNDDFKTKYFLRISSIDKYKEKKKIFETMQKLDNFNIPMSKPIQFGICKKGVYTLQSWIDGKNAKSIIPTLSYNEQYALGMQAGEIQKTIHSLNTQKRKFNWETKYNHKIINKLKSFYECGITFKDSDKIVSFIENNRSLLKNRPIVLQHGDYHISNMMIDSDKLKIIDFDRCDFGDAYEDLKSITWDVQLSPDFAAGRINGYFENNPPIEFWNLLKLYICVGTISSITWAIPYGEDEIKIMKDLANEFISWYDNSDSSIPKWYTDNFNHKS